jgi:hypothetical protein
MVIERPEVISEQDGMEEGLMVREHDAIAMTSIGHTCLNDNRLEG